LRQRLGVKQGPPPDAVQALDRIRGAQLRNALAEAEQVATTGMNPKGEPLPGNMVADARADVERLRARLQAIGEEPPRPLAEGARAPKTPATTGPTRLLVRDQEHEVARLQTKLQEAQAGKSTDTPQYA